MSGRLLCVSNGHGEDVIAAEILRHLPDVPLAAYPLVGPGDAYPPTLPRLDPRRAFPSGGFAFRTGFRPLLADLRSGFVPFWLAQRRTLTAQRGQVHLTVAVGDAYCLWMAAHAGAPVVLVATAESVRNARFTPLYLRLLRGHALRVYARDVVTADFLGARGIDARYAGNAMLDALHPTGADLGVDPGRPVVALLPGSRREAPRNVALLAQVAAAVARERPEVAFLLSVPPTLPGDVLAAALPADGALPPGRPHVVLTHAFADALQQAMVVVGLAGTGNEQAAGLGKPVVAFPTPGPQFTRGFLTLQARLLGEALVPTRSPADAAHAVLRLLGSAEERGRRGRAGRERMGEPGAAARIARDIAALFRDAPAPRR